MVTHPKTINHQSTGQKLSRAQSRTVCRHCELVSKLFSRATLRGTNTLWVFVQVLETCVQRGGWHGSPVSSELWLICCIPVKGLHSPEEQSYVLCRGCVLRGLGKPELSAVKRGDLVSCVFNCRPWNLQIPGNEGCICLPHLKESLNCYACIMLTVTPLAKSAADEGSSPWTETQTCAAVLRAEPE